MALRASGSMWLPVLRSVMVGVLFPSSVCHFVCGIAKLHHHLVSCCKLVIFPHRSHILSTAESVHAVALSPQFGTSYCVGRVTWK